MAHSAHGDSAAMLVAIDELLGPVMPEQKSSDSAFVSLFKDALWCADSQAPYESDEPWGDEVSDFLLTKEIVDKYSMLCFSLRGTSDADDHASNLLKVVPSSLHVACKEAKLGPNSLRVVQFFINLFTSVMNDDDDNHEDGESTEEGNSEAEEEQEEPEEGKKEKEEDLCVEPEPEKEQKEKEEAEGLEKKEKKTNICSEKEEAEAAETDIDYDADTLPMP